MRSFAGGRLTFLKLGSVLFCMFIDDRVRLCLGPWRGFKFFSWLEGLKIEF